jgi:hypothetical protein
MFMDLRQLGEYLETKQELDQYHKRMVNKRLKSKKINKLFKEAFRNEQ